jgi:hypothetical protein
MLANVGPDHRVVVLHLDPQAGEDGVAELAGWAVRRVHDQQVIARATHREESERDRGESAGSERDTSPALACKDLAHQRLRGGRAEGPIHRCRRVPQLSCGPDRVEVSHRVEEHRGGTVDGWVGRAESEGRWRHVTGCMGATSRLWPRPKIPLLQLRAARLGGGSSAGGSKFPDGVRLCAM